MTASGVSSAISEPVLVAALGDSLIHGYGLPVDQGFVPQLQAVLDKGGIDAQIVNAGVSGDTTAGGLARLDWTLSPDIDALIVSLGGNDALRGLDPVFAQQNLAKILETANSRGVPVLLVGIMAPANFGPDYKEQFDAIHATLAEEYGTLFYPNFFTAIVNQQSSAQALPGLMQSDGIHPNANGVALIVEDMAPSIVSLVQKARQEP